jgi:hypothetical protein
MKRSVKATATAVPAFVLALGLSLSGCSAASTMSSGDYASEESFSQSDSGGSDSIEPQLAVEHFDGVTAVTDNREVITTGQVTITAEEPIVAADEAIRITAAAGGRVDARTEQAPVNGDKGSATLTLRLPSATLTASIDKLKKLGDVEQISLASLDVTTQARDIDARITALEAAVGRLLALLSTASDTKTLIELETAVSERQAELESLTSQRRYLSDQVSLSTIELTLISVADAPIDEPVNFWTGLSTGWSSLVAAASGLLIVVGVLLPWLVVGGIIAAAIVVIVRLQKRTARPQPTPLPAAAPSATEADASKK